MTSNPTNEPAYHVTIREHQSRSVKTECTRTFASYLRNATNCSNPFDENGEIYARLSNFS